MQNGGQRNRQGGDVGQCIEVCRACAVAHPQPFLTCGFEAGMAALSPVPLYSLLCSSQCASS